MIVAKWYFKVFIITSTLCFTLLGCEQGINSNTDSTISEQYISTFSGDNKWPDSSDLALLRSSDLFDVRMGLHLLSSRQYGDHIQDFKDLWNGEGVLIGLINKELFEHPVVKLSIIQGIIKNGEIDNEYFEYAKKALHEDDIVLITVAAETIRDIYSVEALYILRELADAEDEMLAEIGISGIRHQTLFGDNRETALSLWADLTKSNTLYRETLERYNQMYDSYLRERERRINDGFFTVEEYSNKGLRE